jgi:hypothetical protein
MQSRLVQGYDYYINLIFGELPSNSYKGMTSKPVYGVVSMVVCFLGGTTHSPLQCRTQIPDRSIF